MLLRLHGALNVANLVAVYEDADYVHLVMELCRGGELLARARKAHYSERTVRCSLSPEVCGHNCSPRIACTWSWSSAKVACCWHACEAHCTERIPRSPTLQERRRDVQSRAG